MAFTQLLQAIRELVLPMACIACAEPIEGQGPFCPSCRQEIIPAASPQDDPSPGRHFDQARALAWHQGALAQAVRDFKYRRRIFAGRALAQYWAKRAPLQWLGRAQVAAPVPLHPYRLMTRGFNQSQVLGAELAKNLDAAWLPGLLRRSRHTRPQVGMGPQDRQQNVRGAFVLNPGLARAVEGKTVLIIDDVFTTGATSDECARVLKKAGARTVLVHTLVRAGEPASLPNQMGKDIIRPKAD